jgi:hypothetical protein
LNRFEPLLKGNVIFGGETEKQAFMPGGGETMKKMLLLTAAVFLLGSSTCGYAAPKGNAGTAGTFGASEFSPGDRMRDSGGPRTGARGASEFSPGDRMRDSRGPRTGTWGASEFSPGDQKNDMRNRR